MSGFPAGVMVTVDPTGPSVLLAITAKEITERQVRTSVATITEPIPDLTEETIPTTSRRGPALVTPTGAPKTASTGASSPTDARHCLHLTADRKFDVVHFKTSRERLPYAVSSVCQNVEYHSEFANV